MIKVNVARDRSCGQQVLLRRCGKKYASFPKLNLITRKTLSNPINKTICENTWSVFFKTENWSQAQVAHTCNPTQEAEIRRIAVQSHLGQIVHETLS
jgi:argonaute-like protein implicated in RNA metabolism and viral defense